MSDVKGATAGCDDPCKGLNDIREYAWNWFSYHAAQRTNMFNYALAAAAILAAGYGAVLEKSVHVAGAIGFVGAFVCLCFMLLDRRNHQLVRYGEDVLKSVEAVLFAAVKARAPDDGKPPMPDGILLVDSPDTLLGDLVRGKHRIYLRLVEGVLLVAFLAGGYVAWWEPELFRPNEPDAALAIQHVADGVGAAADSLRVIGDKLSANRGAETPP